MPYMLIVGDKEIATGNVSVRLRSGKQKKDLPFNLFREAIVKSIKDKTKELEL